MNGSWWGMSGSGYGTAPGATIWFCHLCNWSGVLLSGEYHRCKRSRP